MTDLELHLLNDFQRDFPLAPAPFGVIAGRLGISEAVVLEALARLQACGKVSRVGAVFRPHSIGSSTLAALAVPAEKLDEAAQIVSSYAEVNHNYEREHRYNLWFVVAAPDETRVQEVLAEIGHRTAHQPLHLPLLEDFHIDLGFDLSRPHKGSNVRVACHIPTRQAALKPDLLIGAIQHGLPLVARPFAEVGARIGLGENEVIAGLASLAEQGVIKRLGVVVRHHELGYRANAMVVWDIPDDRVSALGQSIGSFDCVTLCYRRPRRLPAWRYNLFTMIHGRHRDEVLGLVAQLKEQCGLEDTAHEILFSSRRFKQCGAHYVASPAAERVGARCNLSASTG
ncbi:MAG: AsnC family transcriptional regulator [Gallionellales bacterium RIFCSPLOWO2_12_FULL_59_22]|nr:MAG: AsnC family transcriptional regulator [Gallionellales bacterium RIFCSPLOWO2_02_FULL_59_110]OGT01638.1 MAG: AsnC family transcriptional regulator [Gallionellales bacterium RIFCSPLOWO2_02_58_13]OGT13790.1 MAG: AsnC family transcriptional regulator [Gallionellales bacterium RIFCSPLOWO2_12_FULL_59_22]